MAADVGWTDRRAYLAVSVPDDLDGLVAELVKTGIGPPNRQSRSR